MVLDRNLFAKIFFVALSLLVILALLPSYDLTKIKVAMSFLNAVFLTILAVSFISTMDSRLSTLIFSEDFIRKAIDTGFSANGLLELLIKILTLPYVLAGIWGTVLIEVRQSIISTKNPPQEVRPLPPWESKVKYKNIFSS